MKPARYFRHPLTLLILLGMLAIGASVTATSSVVKYKDYVGSKKCTKCHNANNDDPSPEDVWLGSNHYESFEEFTEKDKVRKIAKAMNVKPAQIKTSRSICAGCHYTVREVNGRAKVVSGISCESCHGPGKKWYKKHNKTLSGKKLAKGAETPAQTKARHTKMDQLGMIRAGNLYGFARNCYSCHLVARESLVLKGGHKAGSDFNFYKRTQDETILHTRKASPAKAKLLKVVGATVELEMSLRALSNAKPGTKYSRGMKNRVSNSLAILAKFKSAGPEIGQIISSTKKIAVKASNYEPLTKQANNIRQLIQKFLAKTKYAGIKVAPEQGKRPAAGSRPDTGHTGKKKETPRKDKDTGRKKDTGKKQQGNTRPAQPQCRYGKFADGSCKPKPCRYGWNPDGSCRSKPQRTIEMPPTAIKPMILGFKLLTPSRSALCRTRTPLQFGQKEVTGTSSLDKNACFTAQYTARTDARVYLVLQSPDGTLKRLLPNECRALGHKSNRVKKGASVYFPQSGSGRAGSLPVGSMLGTHWVWVIAIADEDTASRFEAKISNMSGPCNKAAAGMANNPAGFRKMLEQLNRSSGKRLQFQGRSFQVR